MQARAARQRSSVAPHAQCAVPLVVLCVTRDTHSWLGIDRREQRGERMRVEADAGLAAANP